MLLKRCLIPGYLSGTTFYAGKVGTIYYNAYTAEQIGTSHCYDLDSGKIYNLVNGTFDEVSSTPNFDAFSLKLYLLQYMPAVTTSAAHSLTFNMLSNNQQDTVKDYLQDVKSLQHDFKNLESPTSVSSHFCFSRISFLLIVVLQHSIH